MKISRGKFIVIEGLDGSGSTSQVASLVDYLKIRGIKAYATKEPTDNVIGGLIRGALTGVYKLPKTTLQMLFSADRGHHVERFIEPLISNGGWVVCDRYMWSTISFGGLDLDKEWLLSLQKYFPMPDVTFLLKVDPEICINRISNDRYNVELYERSEKLKDVWKNYEWLAGKFSKQIVIVDGMRSEREVFSEIAKRLENLIVTK